MRHKLTPELRWWRVALIAWGVAFFLWLPFEDIQSLAAIGFGASACALLAARFCISGFARRWQMALAPTGGSRAPILLFFLGLGLLAGLAVSPATMALMAFKSGVHAHPSPDFTPGQVLFVVSRTLVWGAGGLLVGLLVGLRAWRKR